MTDATDRRGITPETEYDDEGNAELFVMPDQVEHGGGDEYVAVTQQVRMTLAFIEDRLKTLREQKERIRAEIKRLVTQEHMLKRMAKIADKDSE